MSKITKGVAALYAEAQTEVETWSVEEAKEHLGDEEGVFWSGPSAIAAAGLDPLMTDLTGNYGHGNGVEDFYEIWTWEDANFPVTGLIEICDSPRNVNLIVVEERPDILLSRLDEHQPPPDQKWLGPEES